MAPGVPLWLLDWLLDFGKSCEFGNAEGHPQTRRSINAPRPLKHILFYKKMNEEHAASLIQRNYRGYRERRQLQGLGLSASDRWKEALKELEYRRETRPLSRDARSKSADQRVRARQNWRRIGAVTRRAGGDDSSDDSEVEESMTPEQAEDYRRNKMAAKLERDKTAKMMELQYFLEMVDVKHRYGSNLRTYHEQWRSANTDENFFYWLDYGGGRHLDLPIVSRATLDSERVRYLSREERLNYLTIVDADGRLCWAKSGERISTTPFFKDTLNGIVPIDDAEQEAWKHGKRFRGSTSGSTSSSSSVIISPGSNSDNEESQHYVNHDLKKAKGLHKLKHVSAATILNKLLQKSVKPNSWIFVADTSFRLYVGIKQSGAFQHSSFLHGARISAAGLIKIKDGQLRSLSPLSGHYRPPTKNFRLFVHSLRDEGVDMSRVSISQAYAILVGLEAYVRTKKKLKHGFQHAEHEKERVLHPDEVRKREQEALDQSQSARKEREILAAQAEQARSKRRPSIISRWSRKLGLHLGKPKDGKAGEKSTSISVPTGNAGGLTSTSMKTPGNSDGLILTTAESPGKISESASTLAKVKGEGEENVTPQAK